MYHFTEREKSKEMLLTSKPSLIYVMLIWSLFVTIYFGLQTILLQNMYQNPQSAAQVADGTSKHYRQLFSPGKPKVRAALHCTWFVKNLPNKIGPENFLYFIVSERSSSLWWRNDILSRTDFSYLFLFFLLCSVFFLH